MSFEEIFFYLWLPTRALFIVLLFIFLVTGLDDLFIDLTYYSRRLFRYLFRRRAVHPVSREQLDSIPEKPGVLVVPAWDESNVIRQMLINTITSVDYKNYVIFVGTYPNDEATKLEVEKVREIFPNVECVVTPADGPTNKADCLNWVHQGIELYEKEHGIRFEFYLFHDAEDIVHPLSLKFYNYLIPRVHFIQIPVFPLPGKWYDFVTGVYMDEFAEAHTKELRVRELVANTLPSAGVGTAMSREAIDFLASSRQQQIFDVESLTEDYLMGLSLHNFKGRKIFLQQAVSGVAGSQSGEPIATRELFPTRFRDAVRQKARWILGIGLQGWKAGWTRSLGANYHLYRDRRAVFTNLVVVLGYLVVFFAIGCAIASALSDRIEIPPLVEGEPLLYNIMIIVLTLFCWRLVSRVHSTWHIYGPLHGLMAAPRMIFGNFLNFCATCAGIKRFVLARRHAITPAWGKTAHAFPTEDQLRNYHRKLGDILLSRRMITETHLEEALAKKADSGKALGQILLDMGALWDEDLVFALGEQFHRPAVEIDPETISDEVKDLVPHSFAEHYRVCPLALEGQTMVVATAATDFAQQEKLLSRRLNRPVSLRWASSRDIEFAILRAYGHNAGSAPGARLGDRLLAKELITPAALKNALRMQKRTGEKLGEALVRMQALTQDQLDEAMQASQ